MSEAELIEAWNDMHTSFEKICLEYDKQWQKRKRILNSKLLVILICKSVLSHNKLGYANIINDLWESCEIKTIDLPKLDSIAASSLCEARQKLPEKIFTSLNDKLIDNYNKQKQNKPTWHGHRIFAIDGSKINLPRELMEYQFRFAKDRGRHYPSGMISCLYNLHDKLIYDSNLANHNDERASAIANLKSEHLQNGDVIIFDRGYFSYLMLYLVKEQGLNAVFRVQFGGNINSVIQKFAESEDFDKIIDYVPSEPVKNEIKNKGYKIKFEAIKLRLIKYVINHQIYICATTLLSDIEYQHADFCDLYHSRWGIEELYKVSKCHINFEEFHSKSLRGVRQEIFAHFLLINLARFFDLTSNVNNVLLETSEPTTDEASSPNDSTMQLNFKNCLSTVSRNIENLILGSEQVFKKAIKMIKKSIEKVKHKIRPNRSFPRVSFKPRNSWTSFGRGAKARTC